MCKILLKNYFGSLSICSNSIIGFNIQDSNDLWFYFFGIDHQKVQHTPSLNCISLHVISTSQACIQAIERAAHITLDPKNLYEIY